MSLFLRAAPLCAVLFALAAPCAGQGGLLTVTVDCPGYVPGCDQDFFQTEVPFARFVRDQSDADVYVLVVDQDTGGGGERYTLFFQGRRGELRGRRDTLVTSTPPGASDDDQRRALLSRIRLGLVSFAARTGLADRMTIGYQGPAAAEAVEPVSDPWNSWVFRARGNGFFSGESRSQSLSTYGSFRASRVTESLKVSMSPDVSYDRSSYELSDGSTFVSDNVSYGVGGRVVKSLSDHWSVGAQAGASRSTFSNYDLRVRAAPAVEYNLFPYQESTRRQLRVAYEGGGELAVYADTTIFLKTREVLPYHEASVSAEFKQPWGSVDLYSGLSQYLTALDKINASIGGGVEFRLFRGLSLEVDGRYSLIRDQINLPSNDASDGDVLTSQQELATAFSYFGSVGVSYSFGSIYNQVVNARFGG